MGINITAAGGTSSGTANHQLTKVNVNIDLDYIYYSNLSGQPTTAIPSAITAGTSFLYTSGVGAIGGLTSGNLYYILRDNDNYFKLSTTLSGTAVDLTSDTAGAIALNKPVVYSNTLNIDSSTSTNQAVSYYTAGSPMTGLVSGNTYFLKNVSATFTGSQALYTLTSNTHTFTSCGKTGRLGPTQSEMRAAYSTATWSSTYISQGNYQGYQDWTVPVSGVYEFTAKGASGYDGDGAGGVGLGAIVKGQVTLTKGEVITIAVGQVGTAPSSGATWGGSGGGTFIVRKSNNAPLFVAGGGSAEASGTAGRSGVLTTLGGTSTNGALGGLATFGGRSTGGYSGGGGGFVGAGDTSSNGSLGGGSFSNGLTMTTNALVGGYGGFGGAGQSDGNTAGQSGGAGGYSGGAGSRSTAGSQAGGGGGSYITPTAINVATSTGLFEGSSSFSGSTITNLAAYNTGDGSVILTLVSSFTTGNEVYPTAADSEAGTNKIAIAAAGSSYHAFVPINYDALNDQIHSSSTHGFGSGDAIVPTFYGISPTGLTTGTTYYVDKVNNFSYRLSTTPSPSFTTVNLTAPSTKTTTSDKIARVIVNTSQDTLTINNHGFLVDQPLLYDVGGGTAIPPLQDQATYYVHTVVDANRIKLKIALTASSAIHFTAPGTGTSHSFIFLTVNAAEDTLYLPNHGLVSGQAVKYGNGGGTTIPGLTNNSIYYVAKVDNSIIKLATNSALTTIANITGPGTGTQTLTINSIDFTTDTITIPAHGFSQGELVLYDSKGQTVVSGLTTATPYYIIFVDGDNIRLATTPTNATNGVAVDLVATPSGVGTQSLQSLSKTPDGIYTIASVPTTTSFTLTARGRVPLITKTFNPRASIDLNLSAFKINSHGFLTGTKVTYGKGPASTVITGLTDATDYYVVAINRDYFKLATSSANALAGITVTVSDYGTGVAHTLTSSQINGNITGGGTVTVGSGSVLVNGTGTSFSKILKVGDRFRLFPPNTTNSITFASTDVNTTTNIITKASHGFTTGDTVIFSAGGGVSPSPLVDNYFYFVRAVTTGTLTLHSSYTDATSNTNAADITTQGTGSAFTLTRTAPVGPIIRRITAIGSDTQITVDRPYSNAYSAVSYSYPTFVYVRPQGYSLHRPFDGGVEMSVGAKTSLGQIIRQTRKYFRYQSGKGIQTSFGINYKPSIDLESMTKYSSSQIVCKTRRPHGLVSGLYVRISQATDSFGVTSTLYNGDFQVTVDDLTTFRINAPRTMPADGNAEAKAYGFPQFFVREWTNGAIRAGMFDFQNGMFYEFDGQNIYAVRRSSTQQLAGTAAALQGSEIIFGTGTKFTAQLTAGDMVVMRGQSYRIVQIDSDTRMSIRPEYKGSSGTEKEFNPQTVVNTTTDTFTIISHGFSNLLPVVYNSIDGDAIGGLVNGKTYYVNLIDSNSFKLYATPTSSSAVDLSSQGTTTVHSFTPAKSGIIVTKTVDLRVPQSQWNIDPCDGSGVTGYNLDLSKIQMSYIDFSWYGAGKIRFGFKTTGGQVQYVHEFIHNNKMYESYFRSGNLPTRYEVVTYDTPTYIPFLFHWGTSVIMDGRFDDDKAYLFTAQSQTLTVPGTTAKSFAASAINVATNLVAIQSHGFTSGDLVQFEGISTAGTRGLNTQNPAIDGTTVTAYNNKANIVNASTYFVYAPTTNTLGLFANNTDATGVLVSTVAQSANVVTVVSATHSLSTGDIVKITGLTQLGTVTSYYGPVTVTNSTTFTFTVTTSATISTVADAAAKIVRLLDITGAGNTQYTFFIYPNGALNNTSGPGYQPLISLRLSPSVSSGLTGKLGDRDILNRMQLRLQEVGISSTQLTDVKLILNGRLNNLNFQGVASPSLTQVVNHTSQDTISGGTQVYNFRGAGNQGQEATTTVDISGLFELSNSILGGDSTFPDGPDILTICVSRLTGNATQTSAKLTWTEAQA
jgi:Glycine rich protein